MLVLRPKTRLSPETIAFRILMFTWSLGPLLPGMDMGLGMADLLWPGLKSGYRVHVLWVSEKIGRSSCDQDCLFTTPWCLVGNT